MIDHLVYATTDLERTVAEMTDRLGVEPTAGGSHNGLGTRNELVGLGGSTYLEIVGPDPDQPEPERPRPFGIDTLHRPRLVAWCARPNSPLDETVADANAAGWDPGPIMAMSRRRPDGVVLTWRLTMPQIGPTGIAPLPFLIDWGTSPHPTASLNHEVRLIHLRIECRQPEAMSQHLEVLSESGSVELIDASQIHLSALLQTPKGPLTFS